LVAGVLERARARGMVAVDLEIDADHRRAASLYERSGFHRLERSRWTRKLASDAA
jgi:ribosomal protein S18 acetylase RimI-like enzyme